MRARQKAVLTAAIIALVALAGVGGWLLRGAGSDSTTAVSAAPDAGIKLGHPTIVTPKQLKQFSGDHYPLYWAGTRPNTKLELTWTSKDATFVRYIPTTASAGDKGRYLTVATYGDVDGYTALTSAEKKVAGVTRGQNGAVIAVFKKQPNSTYFSFKNAGFQVEVFSPRAGESKSLTDGGSIKLVGGTR